MELSEKIYGIQILTVLTLCLSLILWQVISRRSGQRLSDKDWRKN